MPSHFVNQTGKAGEIRREAKVVRRYGPRDAQQPLDHSTPAIRTRQIERVCVCKQPFEHRRPVERSYGGFRGIQSGIA